MGIRSLVAVAACVFLSACGRTSPWYPVPPQQQFSTEPERVTLHTLIAMTDPDTHLFIVRDIPHRGLPWRWTRERPEVKVRIDNPEGWTFRADFVLPEKNLHDTGPVTISFLVNGQMLDKVRYTTEGPKTFSKRVPAAWLAGNEDVSVGAVIDPPWIAPGDKARLGFVLYQMGLER